MEEKYNSLVWQRAKKDTQEYYRTDRRSWVYNVWSSIIVAVIAPIVYGEMGLIMPEQLVQSIVAGVASGVIFFGLWRAGVFVHFWWTAHEKLYRDMEAEAYKRKWVNVSIDIPKVFEVNPHGACLVIVNHKKGWSIQKAGIKLIRVIEGNRAMLETILESNDVWIPRSRGGVLYPRGTIHPNENGVYSIAHWNDNEAWMNRMDNLSISEKIPLKKDMPYIITLKFIGEVDGKWMDENQRRYAVRYVNQKVELKELT